MIKVAVAGYAGRMGSAVVDAVTAADDMTVVCGIDPHAAEAPFPVFGTLAEALDAADVDVLVDFTQPNVVAGNLSVALPRGVDSYPDQWEQSLLQWQDALKESVPGLPC